MAVSGRKTSDFQDSFSQGSAEDFDHCCDPCLTEGQHVEANGYCLDCHEYLCSSCFRYHKKSKTSRNHQLLDKDNMDRHSTLPKPTDVCTVKCSIHRNEVIKFFCPKHEEIGCTDCMTMNHKPCELDYIPDRCTGIGDSDEYREVVKELDQKLTEADAILKKAAIKDKEIDDNNDRIIKEIVKKRKDIDDHLDAMQKKIVADASKKKATSKQEVKAVVTSCTNFTSNVKKLISSIQNSRAADQNGKLFIEIKRAKSELQSGEIQQAKMSLGKIIIQLKLNSNNNLDNILAVESFGELTELEVAVDVPSKPLQALAVTPRKRGTFNKLQHKTDINLNNYCHITGCVTLSSDTLVLAAFNKLTLMVVNTDKNVVIEVKKLGSQPWDIAGLPGDKIAVTMPHKKQILIMTTTGKLSMDVCISVAGGCWGIIYHQNWLYVLCGDPYKIHVLDMEGNTKNIISPKNRAVFGSYYIALSRDQSKLYVSSSGNSCILSMTLQGEVSVVYKHKDLDRPLGMVVLDDGSLLVCCENNNSIHHISADLKQGRRAMDGLYRPQSICYSADKSEVCIGADDSSDVLKICSVIYKM